MTKVYLVNGLTSQADIAKYRSEGCRIVHERFADALAGDYEIVKPKKKREKKSKPAE